MASSIEKVRECVDELALALEHLGKYESMVGDLGVWRDPVADLATLWALAHGQGDLMPGHEPREVLVGFVMTGRGPDRDQHGLDHFVAAVGLGAPSGLYYQDDEEGPNG